MTTPFTRRDVLRGGAAALGAALLTPTSYADAQGTNSSSAADPWKISLNTSTVRGHKLPFDQVIDIAAKAGYAGIEPWPDEIDRYLEKGGTLKDAAKRLKDNNLAVTGAIAFFHWMVDDDAARARGFEEAKKRFDQLSQLGATHVAAPPAGDGVDKVDLLRAAERYRALLELSDGFGVVPGVEVWGFAKNCYRLGQCVMVAIESQHPKACVVPDIYHLHKGGSGLAGIKHLSAGLVGGFHLNDYPADPPRETTSGSCL